MFQVRILNAGLSYDIKRLTRLSNFSTNFASSLIPVGRRISSSHRHSSVVTGLRIYTANNNVDADPVKYRIEGRGMMAGANIETRHSDKCLVLDSYSDAYRIAAGNCASNDSNQRFYMNELGEIRAGRRCTPPRRKVPYTTI